MYAYQVTTCMPVVYFVILHNIAYNICIQGVIVCDGKSMDYIIIKVTYQPYPCQGAGKFLVQIQ